VLHPALTPNGCLNEKRPTEVGRIQISLVLWGGFSTRWSTSSQNDFTITYRHSSIGEDKMTSGLTHAQIDAIAAALSPARMATFQAAGIQARC
jgi:hypothetical protein